MKVRVVKTKKGFKVQKKVWLFFWVDVQGVGSKVKNNNFFRTSEAPNLFSSAEAAIERIAQAIEYNKDPVKKEPENEVVWESKDSLNGIKIHHGK